MMNMRSTLLQYVPFFFFFFNSAVWDYTGCYATLSLFFRFYEVFSESILVSFFLLRGIVCLLLLCPFVSSHPLSTTNSAVCWVHQLKHSVHQTMWKLSERGPAKPFNSFSNSEPGAQFSCSGNCRWSLHEPYCAHPEFDSKIPPECHRRNLWSPLVHVAMQYNTSTSFVASSELNIAICGSNSYLLSVYITLRKAVL